MKFRFATGRRGRYVENKDQDLKCPGIQSIYVLLDLADCRKIVLQFDNKLNMRVSEYVILRIGKLRNG